QQTYLDAKKYVEFIVVVDHGMVTKYKGDLKKIKTRMYELVNIMNEICIPLNIRVALTGLVIWLDRDKINVQSAANVTLALFGVWRATVLLQQRSHDCAQLFTYVSLWGKGMGVAGSGG
ncbi:zinc metalloproteinase-disintegrin-like ACLD, partial [Protobothrops mucrosquamatus]|uniref:zinc metalloproteinase-disintegrin-like ACLD n=1 Tax=Protobothrops mucrosquamatus TaxID=103944 RepID=UPI0007758425